MVLRPLLSLGFGCALVVLLSCEALVPNDPSYKCASSTTCTGTPPGQVSCVSPLGACPSGQFCKDPGCAPCLPPGTDPCDHYDNDCDGMVDNGPLSDRDGDGYTVCGQFDKNGNTSNIDCDDNNPLAHPGAPEVCNGQDDDCDNGATDEAVCPAGFVCKPGLQRANPADNCIMMTSDCTTKPCTPPDTCDMGTGQCIPPAANPLGDPCMSDRQCMDPQAFCGYSSALGSAGNGICTKDCCTASDCPAQFVCFAPGTGGKYCVKKELVGITALGALLPGAGTAQASNCRSGQSLNGACVDTCCSSGNCQNGTVCKYGSLFGKVALACQPPTGSKNQASFCTSNSTCREGICDTNLDLCVNPCCTSGTCAGDFIGDYVCRVYEYGTSGTGGALSACAATSGQRGTGTSGASCSADTDCVGLSCTTSASHPAKFCSDFCCTDTDCQNGTLCRPVPAGGPIYALRCTFP